MPSVSFLNALTVRMLHEKAKAAGIKRYSRLRKADLVAMLAENLDSSSDESSSSSSSSTSSSSEPEQKERFIRTTPNRRKVIKPKKGDRISVGHAIINIYTGRSKSDRIPRRLAKTALDANKLNKAHQKDILNNLSDIGSSSSDREEFLDFIENDVAERAERANNIIDF